MIKYRNIINSNPRLLAEHYATLGYIISRKMKRRDGLNYILWSLKIKPDLKKLYLYISAYSICKYSSVINYFLLHNLNLIRRIFRKFIRTLILGLNISLSISECLLNLNPARREKVLLSLTSS